jgi:hypothetical protein
MSKITYFEVLSGKFIFGAYIRVPEKVFDEDVDTFYIGFGGTSKCIDITVYENDSIAYISGLRYNDACALNCKLPTGDDGTLIMILSALRFVVEKFQYVKEFHFTDDSKIECKKNKYISLMYYYLAKYGQTWYQVKLKALPVENGVIDKINTFESYMTSIKTMDFKEFFRKFVIDNCMTPKQILVHKTVLEEFYNNSNTYREFVINVDKAFPKRCIVFYKWLDKFVLDKCKVYAETKWKCSASISETQQIHIKSRNKTPFTNVSKKKLQVFSGGFLPYGNKPFAT